MGSIVVVSKVVDEVVPAWRRVYQGLALVNAGLAGRVLLALVVGALAGVAASEGAPLAPAVALGAPLVGLALAAVVAVGLASFASLPADTGARGPARAALFAACLAAALGAGDLVLGLALPDLDPELAVLPARAAAGALAIGTLAFAEALRRTARALASARGEELASLALGALAAAVFAALAAGSTELWLGRAGAPAVAALVGIAALVLGLLAIVALLRAMRVVGAALPRR